MYLKEVEGETAGSHTFLPSGSRPDGHSVPAILVSCWCYCWGPELAYSLPFWGPLLCHLRIPGILASAPPVCQLPSGSSLSQCLSPPSAWVRLWVLLSRGLWPPRLCLEKCDKASLCHHILAAPCLPTLSTVDGSGKLCLHSCLSSCLPLGLTLPSITI